MGHYILSSIPLPALGLRPPEQPNLLGQASQIMALRGMQNQQQSQGIALQQQQQQLKDQQAMTSAMQSWDGKDAQDLIKGVIGKGGSAQAVIGLQSHILQQRETLSKIAADDATTGSKNIETQKARADAVLGAINGLKQIPDDQLPQAVAQKVQEMTQQGLIDPKAVGQVQQLAQGDPASIRQHLDTFAKLNSFQSQQLQQAKDQAEIDAKKAQLPGQVADSQKAVKINAGTSPQGLTLDQQMQQRFEAAKMAETKRHNLATENSVDMNDPRVQMNVAAVANGKMKIQDVLTPRVPLPQRQAFLAAVQQANPNFSAADFDIQKGVTKNFTSGAYSQQLTAINTARNHMQTFSSLADALDNGNTQVLNKIGNAIGTQFGSDKVTNFNIAKQAFAGEVGKAFAGANVAEGDRNQLSEQISAASSPAQLKGVAKIADFLLEGKQKALKQTFDAGKSGTPNFGGAQSAAPAQQAAENAPTHAVKDASGKIIGYTSDGRTMTPAP